MPNPDGTRTREEHRRNILALVSTYVDEGMSEVSAIEKAGREYRAILTQEGEDKIALVKHFLGIKEAGYG